MTVPFTTHLFIGAASTAEVNKAKNKAAPKNIEVLLISLHRHTLGQIAGLVYIGAAGGGGVIGQQLQGNDVEDGG